MSNNTFTTNCGIVDIKKSSSKKWIVRVPDYLNEQFKSFSNDGEKKYIGVLKSTQKENGDSDFKISLSANEFEGFPLDFDLSEVKLDTPYEIFSEINGTNIENSVSLEGKVDKRFDLKATDSKMYDKMMENRYKLANEKGKKNEKTCFWIKC